jgi:hypothetical protein
MGFEATYLDPTPQRLKQGLVRILESIAFTCRQFAQPIQGLLVKDLAILRFRLSSHAKMCTRIHVTWRNVGRSTSL